MRPRALCLAALSVFLLAAAPASATTASEAVDFLNQQRAANQIPANITLDDYRTTGCRNHNNYMAQNGDVLVHGEEPGKPGYTAEGADYSNTGEVLAEGGSGFTATTNPWDTAPLHQTILFNPNVDTAGYDESGAFFCMRVHLVFTQPADPAMYAYTSNLGRTNVPRSITVANEGPYAPQEAVGIPQGVPTGPQILFFIDGFGNNHATSYSLTGPGGAAVEAKLVDSTTPPPNGESYKAFQAGGDLIPVNPLEPLTEYTATVAWHNDDSGTDKTQTVTFKTAGLERGVALTLSKRLGKGRKATLGSPAEAVGQKATVRISKRKKGKKAKTSSTKTITLKASQKLKVPKKPGRGGAVIMKVSVPSFTLGDTRITVKSASRTYR
jgi:hypothetical protein